MGPAAGTRRVPATGAMAMINHFLKGGKGTGPQALARQGTASGGTGGAPGGDVTPGGPAGQCREGDSGTAGPEAGRIGRGRATGRPGMRTGRAGGAAAGPECGRGGQGGGAAGPGRRVGHRRGCPARKLDRRRMPRGSRRDGGLRPPSGKSRILRAPGARTGLRPGRASGFRGCGSGCRPCPAR
jgi:hypothetical protein